MNRIHRVMADVRLHWHKDTEVVVIWRDETGEVTVFTARNFQEVKEWLRHAQEAGTLH